MKPHLRAQAAGKVIKMVRRQWDVGVQRLADGLAVVAGVHISKKFVVIADDGGDFLKDTRARSRRRASPSVGGGVRRIQSKFDISGSAAGALGDFLASRRRDHCDET